MTDQFFTPETIAANLTSSLDADSSKIVADFAIGDGSLIRALHFNPQEVIGIDLDPKVIDNLTKLFPRWNLLNGDFLTNTGDLQDWLKNYEKGIDLILLNPPFTCKGGKYFPVELDGNFYRCRTAIAFIVHSLKYLAINGKLIAILPLSMLKSELDLNILNKLKLNYEILIGERLGPNSFVGCNPNSVIISITPKQQPREEKLEGPKKNHFKFSVLLTRGATPMHKTKTEGQFPVLHTTNIKGGKFSGISNYSDKKNRYVKGKVLLITRVGLPNKDKILVFNFKRQYVLSDCLIGIQTKDDPKNLNEIRNIILTNWVQFASLYDSTCAPYITVKILQDFLSLHGINSSVVSELSGFSQFSKSECKFELVL